MSQDSISDGDGPKRRMSDHKIQALADSALLKVLMYGLNGVVAVAMAAVGYGLDKVLTRLDTIEKANTTAQVDNAGVQFRLLSLEKATSNNEASLVSSRVEIANIATRLLTLELEQKQLREHIVGNRSGR